MNTYNLIFTLIFNCSQGAFVCACSVAQSCPTLLLCEQQSPRLFCPWNFPGKTTGAGGHWLLQGLLTNPGIERLSPESPASAGRFFITVQWETFFLHLCTNSIYLTMFYESHYLVQNLPPNHQCSYTKVKAFEKVYLYIAISCILFHPIWHVLVNSR